MKKIILTGLVLAMVMGLAGMASAGDATNWTVMLRAGVLSGTTWLSSLGATTIGVEPVAVTPTYHASFTSAQAGIYGIDPDSAKRANKDVRLAGPPMQVWNMKLETGASWLSTSKITVGWWIPVVAETFAGTPVQVSIYRNNVLQSSYVDDAQYGTTKIKVAATDVYLGAGVIEDWKVVAVVPEPGSMVAMMSGLVGLVGFGIRRRK